MGNSLCQQVPSLKDHFSRYFRVGTSVSSPEVGYAGDFIKHHFSSITPENELKPDSILNQGASQQWGGNVNPQVSFGEGTRAILRFCEQNGIALRGHTFVWHSQTPEWFFKNNFDANQGYVSKDIMNLRLENFIKNTFALIKSEFPNLNLYAYDVCNEVFLNDGGGYRPKGQSRWMDVYGDDSFIFNGFRYARQYAPQGCKLFLNDYNEYIPAKTNNIVDLANRLKQQGIIDGIGLQSHLSTDYPDIQTYMTAFNKFRGTGLMIMITELDITTNGDFSKQAQMFKDIFQAGTQTSGQLHSLTVWGTTDERSWRSSGHPLLFSNYQPKEAYFQVMTVGVKEEEKEETNLRH